MHISTNPNSNGDYYAQKVSKLQKEKNNLILRNNEQKTMIAKLKIENEKLQADLREALINEGKLEEKYNKLKATTVVSIPKVKFFTNFLFF